MPGPLSSLQKATSIGPNPWAPEPEDISQGIMPGPPSGAISGLLGVLGGAGKRLLGLGAEAAPNALQGAAEAIPGELQHAVQSVRDFAQPAAQAMMDKMYKAASPVFRGLEESGMFSGSRVPGGMSTAPRAAAETLGESNPYFTPTGGEGMFNMGRGTSAGSPDAVQAAYQRILNRMGK